MSECASRNAAASRRRWGFLARLFRDRRGNTLAIVGAAMVPLAAMIGSGVDMSRAYMAKTRLQSACDAAALAGRRVMQNDTLDSNVTAEATRFFNFNFPKTTSAGVTTGPYQTAEITAPTVTHPAPGTVRVTASTTIPTSIMKMFGFTTLPLNVTCEAALNFVNTDVMLVLDTTGSMNRDINDNTTTNDALRKITALRAAVMALYDELEPTQTQLQANGLRLRYGIVPYSSTVNVGNLITAVNPAYMRDTSPYQSREALFNNQVNVPNTPTVNGPYWEYYRGTSSPQTGTVASQATTGITQAHCLNFMNNVGFSQGTSPTYSFTATNPNSGGPAPTATVVSTFPSDGTATSGGANGEWGWTGAPVTGTRKSCRRLRTDTTTTYAVRFSFTSWRYIQSNFDTTQLRGGSTTIASNTAGTVATAGQYLNERQMATQVTGVGTTTANWDGCIEERTTLPTIVQSSDLTIPPGAYDLNINYIPTSDEETKWRPHWPQVLWRRDVNAASTTNASQVDYMGDDTGDSVACPTAARRLQAWTEANLQAYVNGLTPRGFTYHDIGMVWGARLLSNAGIFAADNPDTFNSMPVTRHIIFMTDGQLSPNCDAYTSWGIESNDRRVTGSYSCTDDLDRHMQRFHMICDAAKGMGFSVWVIAFGVALTDDMAQCASNPNQAAASTSSADLIARFRQIGSNIGALRLTQ
jgi:Flp pilus assembly protein TadG